MRLGLVAVPLLISTVAYAQAPGEVDPYAPPDQPAVSPPVREWTRHRVSVGLNLGATSVTAGGDAEGTETNFRIAELALRYRVGPHLELELMVGGGRQVLEDDTDGDLAMGGGTFSARYRFRPGRSWDWWLSGGIGATVIELHDSTEEQRDAATRPHVAFGVGLEKRWNRFALHAELRMMGIGPREDQADDAPQVDPPAPEGRPGTTARLPADVRGAKDLSAGVFTLGASFYF